MSRTRWVRSALLAGVFATGLVAPPSQAATGIVVEGRSNGATTVTLPAAVTVTDTVPRLVGGRQYVGVVVESLDTPGVALSALKVRAFGNEASEVVVISGATRLPAGRYAVRLVADGPARAEYATSGDGFRAVTRPRPVERLQAQAATLDPLSAAATDLRLPRAVAAGSRAWLFTAVAGATRVERRKACAVTPNGTCEYDPVPGGSAGTASTSYAVRDVAAAPGRRDALFGVSGFRADEGRLLIAVIDLGK